MYKWLALASVAAGCGFLAPAAHADGTSIDVQSLVDDCKMEQSAPQYWLCLGYIGGIGDQMTLNGMMITNSGDRSAAIKNFAICPKEHPSWGAEIQSFVNWAEKHPEQWQKASLFGVIQAIRQTWPCPPN